MTPLARAFREMSRRARARRAQMFRGSFALTDTTRVLDLGSEDGSHIRSVLTGTPVRPANTYIADIAAEGEALSRGQSEYGFNPIIIDESGRLPFEDGFFDIVYCSSVIEHVTVPKAQVWTLRSGSEFRRLSSARQSEFADEVMRVGKQFFVQTPNRGFLIESHSWLPFMGYLPRRLLVPVLRITNRFWVKRTSPDWCLLNARELSAMFGGAPVLRERFLGLTKSIIVCRAQTQVSVSPAGRQQS